ncbi:hypothetical protein SEUCBS139899_007719 [Sporothrix eucalyptigena]|uniref:Pyruvate decarboxylase n=1 Tax=Sporothrix eucalyptigena TaxID=1812306 RepID=A0ABP0B335_9PEZI
MSNYTTATAILEALEDAGVSHLFVNLGSDHPAILEAISKRKTDAKRAGYKNKLRFVTAPNEFVGLCAAQGYFQTSGQMQAILVHVDAGTQAMGGAIHNVSRARIPVIMLAGTSPVTEEGELVGTRNEFIHYLQDTVDQRGIVRGYTVLNHEIRTGRNAKQLILRAAQMSQSDPKGPSYLIACREVLEEQITPYSVKANKWKPLSPSALAPAAVEQIGQALLNAKSPVVVTSYLGRQIEAVQQLVDLCEATGTAVLEAVPGYLNFPHTHKLYAGNHWSEGLPNGVLEGADVVLVLDCDVPWIKSVFRPSPDAAIYHIDCDPLKVQMSLFHLDTELSSKADVLTSLQQLNTYLSQNKESVTAARQQEVQARIKQVTAIHDAYISGILAKEGVPADPDTITPHHILSRLRHHLPDDALVMSEGISNFRPICDVLMRTLPGTYFTSGATCLGWNGGASLGAKLANPDKLVVNITGDGSFLFSLPENVHWMARKYNAPFLTVILNNRGWKSPMLSALACHRQGHSSQAVTPDDLYVTFDPSCDHSQVAVAAGAGFGCTVKRVDEIDTALQKGLETVASGRAAVIDVWLPKFAVGDRVG